MNHNHTYNQYNEHFHYKLPGYNPAQSVSVNSQNKMVIWMYDYNGGYTTCNRNSFKKCSNHKVLKYTVLQNEEKDTH